MPQFSKTSAARLATCHPDLQKLFNEVIKTRDCTIICGARTLAEQQAAYAGGHSKLDGIKKKSMHQVSKEQPLSLAVDVLPFPLNWTDELGHFKFAAFVLETASKMGIKLEWGGNWQSFVDRPHYQLSLK